MHNACQDLRITLGTGGRLDETRTQCPCLFQPHGHVDAQRPGLVRTGNDASAGYAVGHADRFAAVFGVVQLFNGGKECVDVYERDEAGPVCVVVRHGTIDCRRVNREGSREEISIHQERLKTNE